MMFQAKRKRVTVTTSNTVIDRRGYALVQVVSLG